MPCSTVPADVVEEGDVDHALGRRREAGLEHAGDVVDVDPARQEHVAGLETGEQVDVEVLGAGVADLDGPLVGADGVARAPGRRLGSAMAPPPGGRKHSDSAGGMSVTRASTSRALGGSEGTTEPGRRSRNVRTESPSAKPMSTRAVPVG